MKRSNSGQGGFTMIEVIAATALLVVTASGFLMMAGANAGLLAREHRLDRSSYALSAMAAKGEGEPTGRSLTVEFTMEHSGLEDEAQAIEQFDEYSVSETWEDGGNTMTFYRHR